MQGDTFN